MPRTRCGSIYAGPCANVPFAPSNSTFTILSFRTNPPTKLEQGAAGLSSFRKRLIEPELLDHLPAEEARPNLADLVRINRHFGGHNTLRKLLNEAVQREESFTVLDVGAASGDTADLIHREYPHATVTSLDHNAVNLERARQPKLLADAFRLPFRPDSFDLVLSSLFLHHFTDQQIVALLDSFRGIARRAVLISDLERHILPWLFLRFSGPFLGWNRVTVHDGLISVHAALQKDELRQLALQAGISNPLVRAHRPAFRLTLLGRKT